MMKETRKRLIRVTAGCRDDMHEPGEQGLEARVIGTTLDNAFGNGITLEHINSGRQEIIIILERELPENAESFTGDYELFNLATLIALARKAVL